MLWSDFGTDINLASCVTLVPDSEALAYTDRWGAKHICKLLDLWAAFGDRCRKGVCMLVLVVIELCLCLMRPKGEVRTSLAWPCLVFHLMMKGPWESLGVLWFQAM